MIDIAPVKPDGFSNNSRELIALRCLEGLVEYAGRINSNASSTLNLKVGFDYSESCEDVLLRILQEVIEPIDCSLLIILFDRIADQMLL